MNPLISVKIPTFNCAEYLIQTIISVLNQKDFDLDLLEIEVVDDKVFVYGDYTAFGTLSTALESMGLDVETSNLERIPSSPVEFTEDQLADIEKMLDKIEDDDDIQKVFTNIA